MLGAAKPRYIGNMLEYATAQAILTRGGSPKNSYTQEKYKKWDTTYANSLKNMPTSKLYDVTFANLKIDFSKPTQFELTRDSPSDTTDIYIYNDTQKIPISLKNRNNKIKHQRPKALFKQLALSPLDTAKFQAAYNDINDRYYKKWHDNNLTLFSQLGQTEKQELYDQVMDLTIKWLNSSKHMQTYLNFLLQSTNNNTLCWYPERDRFICIPARSALFKWYRIEKLSTFIYINTDEFRLKIRIHNASSRITPKLQLKYDTSIDSSYLRTNKTKT